MICSVIVPSRKRPEGLWALVNSINECRTLPIEIVVRIDDDDDTYKGHPWPSNVKILVGPRYGGWKSLNIHLTECANAAQGDWIFQLNDDALIQGAGWQEELSEIPTTGFIVQCKYHQLGLSKYENVQGGAFPIVPNGCWRQFGFDAVQDPCDRWLDELLRRDNGWETRFLEKLTTIHNRLSDEELNKHREI